MNNTFDIKRFWKYLVYDLTNAKNNCGLTLLLLGAMPVFMFFFYELFSFIGTGSFSSVSLGAKIPSIVTAFVIAALFFPAKHYGQITGKKEGSAWILLPASKLEKWFSMLLVTCVVVPAFMLAETAACEGLLGLIFPNTYGEMTIAGMAGGLNMAWNEMSIGDNVTLFMSWPYTLYLAWCFTILVFTLGSIYFKKSKIGKTFLALFLISLALSVIVAAVVRIVAGADFDLQLTPADLSQEGFIRLARTVQYVMYALEFALVDFLLYRRIKTIKQ